MNEERHIYEYETRTLFGFLPNSQKRNTNVQCGFKLIWAWQTFWIFILSLCVRKRDFCFAQQQKEGHNFLLSDLYPLCSLSCLPFVQIIKYEANIQIIYSLACSKSIIIIEIDLAPIYLYTTICGLYISTLLAHEFWTGHVMRWGFFKDRFRMSGF